MATLGWREGLGILVVALVVGGLGKLRTRRGRGEGMSDPAAARAVRTGAPQPTHLAMTAAGRAWPRDGWRGIRRELDAREHEALQAELGGPWVTPAVPVQFAPATSAREAIAG